MNHAPTSYCHIIWIWGRPLSQHPLPPWFNPPKQTTRTKQKIIEKDQTPNKSYRIVLAYAQSPAVREVATRLTGQDQEEKTQQKTSWIEQPGLKKRDPPLTYLDLEHSAKKGTNRNKALLNLHWSSWSLPLTIVIRNRKIVWKQGTHLVEFWYQLEVLGVAWATLHQLFSK